MSLTDCVSQHSMKKDEKSSSGIGSAGSTRLENRAMDGDALFQEIVELAHGVCLWAATKTLLAMHAGDG